MTHVRNAPFQGFTPWGTTDHNEQKADGIWWASTPSHGRVWILPERLAAFDDHSLMAWHLGDRAFAWIDDDCGDTN